MNPNYSLKVFKKPSYLGVLSLVYLLLSWWSIVPAHWVHHGVSLHSHSSSLKIILTIPKPKQPLLICRTNTLPQTLIKRVLP